jgi:hypothetical protein
MLEASIATLTATGSPKRNRRWLHSLIVALGLAVFSSPVLAQQQRGIDIGTQDRFPIWRTTTLGSHKGVDSYRDALDAAKMKIGDAADEILGRPAFHYVGEKTELELTLVSVAELGVETESPLSEVYRRATQLGLALCPPEVGPQLRLDYRDQPVGESLLVAMEPVKTYHGEPTILSLMNSVAASHSWVVMVDRNPWCPGICGLYSRCQDGWCKWTSGRSCRHLRQNSGMPFPKCSFA